MNLLGPEEPPVVCRTKRVGFNMVNCFTLCGYSSAYGLVVGGLRWSLEGSILYRHPKKR